jgi:hypothetical protein
MQNRQSNPTTADRLGVLIASVLLTYALTRLVKSPQFVLTLNLPGFYFAYPLSLSTAMTLLAAGLTATGIDWLLHGHPGLGKKSTVEHWMLPTLTTFVIGAPLALSSNSPTWWIGFVIGAVLLTGVFLAEYVVVDVYATYYALARAELTALSYALFLILASALRLAALRMFLLVPIIFIASALISLRILHLDGTDRWDFPWAVGIGLTCAQIGAGLHYWPVSSIQYGLALIGPLYALTTLSASLTENVPIGRAIVGPSIFLSLAWAAAAILR